MGALLGRARRDPRAAHARLTAPAVRSEDGRPIPYAPIARHAVVGDRRTAALVAADGTIDWFCAPRYDSEPIFAALLDADRGGYCRFAPRARTFGKQRHPHAAPIVETSFTLDGARVTLTDAMIDPEHPRSEGEGRRTIVRRLAASADSTRAVECVFELTPRATGALRTWSTHSHDFTLRSGEEAWAVLGWDDDRTWSADRARAALDATRRWWDARCTAFRYEGERRARVLRSLVTIELLGDASTGASVAAVTTSLPERLGGDWSADYRLAWVRDCSLAAATLASAGDEKSSRRWFDFLAKVEPTKDAPLQVLYRVDGDRDASPTERDDLAGYRGSKPVRFGNHAIHQKQLGMFGFLADGADVFRRHGGEWCPEHFRLVARCVDHVEGHWRDADNGIWELPERRHHVSSRILSWLALERAARIADVEGHGDMATRWRRAIEPLTAELFAKGWSERRGAFVHAYGSDALDASALLLPITRLLPSDDPRVRKTIEAIDRELTIDGWVHRFVPCAIDGIAPL
ncbi:MAG TPA: glycoside hydrolase family 15 protein, partial [Labilithrix sp.]